MTVETFGYFVIGFGILGVIYIIVSQIGYKRDTIKMYGKDFWEHSGK